MKKFAAATMVTVLALSLAGCSEGATTQPENESTPKVEQKADPASSVDLENLKVGETAEFDKYSITVNSVEADGTSLVANVTLSAKSDAECAGRYLTAKDASGKEYDPESPSNTIDEKVKAGDSYTMDVEFADKGFDRLRWDNWSNEAEWSFEANAEAVAAKEAEEQAAAAEKEAQAAAAAEAAAKEASATTSQKNALKMAKSYLGTMPFSYSGLIEQLEYEQFSTEDATYGADNCGADWNEQAAKMAKSYLDTMPFSYSGLVEQLEYEGFTPEQATYGADTTGL